jgi:hypothetical protein
MQLHLFSVRVIFIHSSLMVLISMPMFQCKVCEKKVEAEYETCDCEHAHNCHEPKNPQCCGQAMIEIMDD